MPFISVCAIMGLGNWISILHSIVSIGAGKNILLSDGNGAGGMCVCVSNVQNNVCTRTRARDRE